MQIAQRVRSKVSRAEEEGWTMPRQFGDANDEKTNIKMGGGKEEGELVLFGGKEGEDMQKVAKVEDIYMYSRRVMENE